MTAVQGMGKLIRLRPDITMLIATLGSPHSSFLRCICRRLMASQKTRSSQTRMQQSYPSGTKLTYLNRLTMTYPKTDGMGFTDRLLQLFRQERNHTETRKDKEIERSKKN